MKKATVLLFCILAIGLASCSSVKRIDADTQIDLSGRWNDTDIRKVCDTIIAQALASPRIDSFVRDFAAKNGGDVPTVVVGRFRNDSSEHIDTTIISGVMRTAIINSGKLEFVEGGEMREELRAERQDQQGNASEATAAALGNEFGADFMLTGTVNSQIDQAGKTMVRAYFVNATITNVETNRILWEGRNDEIKKVIKQSSAKF